MAASLLPGIVGRAGISVSGTIVNQTWRMTASPYLVTGDWEHIRLDPSSGLR